MAYLVIYRAGEDGEDYHDFGKFQTLEAADAAAKQAGAVGNRETHETRDMPTAYSYAVKGHEEDADCRIWIEPYLA